MNLYPTGSITLSVIFIDVNKVKTVLIVVQKYTQDTNLLAPLHSANEPSNQST